MGMSFTSSPALRALALGLALASAAACSAKKAPPPTPTFDSLVSDPSTIAALDKAAAGCKDDSLRCYAEQQHLKRDVAADQLERVRAAYVTQCDAGSAESCYRASLVSFEGGAETALLTRACDGGFDAACANPSFDLAARAEKLPAGDERTKLERKAHALLERACKAGHSGACDEIERHGR